MQELVLLSPTEQEKLVRAIEGSLDVQMLRQMFTWCQGALGSLLPHGILVCAALGENDQIQHLECLNAVARDAQALRAIADAEAGLAARLVRHCREFGQLCLRLELEPTSPAQAPVAEPAWAERQAQLNSQSALAQELAAHGLRNALVQGTERLRGGATFFVLFEMPAPPTARHEHFLALLLPHMHLAFLRIIANRDSQGRSVREAAPLSSRELEVLGCLHAGRTNLEIAHELALSPLTVKNHLQNIYRKLQVGNRVQALARAQALKLALGQPLAGAARAE